MAYGRVAEDDWSWASDDGRVNLDDHEVEQRRRADRTASGRRFGTIARRRLASPME